MDSRTDKYYDEQTIGTRTQRNNQLYKDINQTELDNFELKSNATVIANNKCNNIDVEKIKSILDTHYNDVPRRHSIKLEEPEETPVPKIKQEETKEYDINVILDKAKEEKVEDYKEDRAKKLRDTQYDILNNLNINPKEYIEDYEDDIPKEDNRDKTGASEDLQKLIDTITLNENDIKKEKIKVEESVSIKEIAPDDTRADDVKVKPISVPKEPEEISSGNPLDIFEDLKGSENTTVLEGLQEKTEKMIQDMHKTTSTPIARKEEKEIKPPEKKEIEPKENTSSLDTSFFTKTSNFKKEDFEEYEDFEEVSKSPSVIIKIIIAILVIIFIVGVVILVKQFIK